MDISLDMPLVDFLLAATDEMVKEDSTKIFFTLMVESGTQYVYTLEATKMIPLSGINSPAEE